MSGTSNSGGIKMGVSVATISGAAIDFVNIPSNAKALNVGFTNVGTNGVSVPIVQIGTAGGVETAGYQSHGTVTNTTGYTGQITTSFQLHTFWHSTYTFSGILRLCLFDEVTNQWAASWNIDDHNGNGLFGAGDKALVGALDRVRLTTVGGTDLFDAGLMNISWEV